MFFTSILTCSLLFYNLKFYLSYFYIVGRNKHFKFIIIYLLTLNPKTVYLLTVDTSQYH